MEQDYDAGFSGDEYDSDEGCASEDDGIGVALTDAADAENSSLSDCQVCLMFKYKILAIFCRFLLRSN